MPFTHQFVLPGTRFDKYPQVTGLYFVRQEELALDNYGHLVISHSQICQPFNDSQSTKQYFTRS